MMEKEEADKFFGKYKKKKNPEKNIKLGVKTDGLRQIISGFKKFMGTPYHTADRLNPLAYRAKMIVKDYKYELTDLRVFCDLDLVEYKMELVRSLYQNFQLLSSFPNMAGVYLSALVQKIAAPETEIRLRFYPEAEVAHFGYKLQKACLGIEGALGPYSFSEANKCKVTFAQHGPYCMGYKARNCEFTINGRAGQLSLEHAKKCKLYIKGNSDFNVGLYASNCEIHINGNKLSNTLYIVGKETTIFKKGKQIYPKKCKKKK